jgi:hypothetical protein
MRASARISALTAWVISRWTSWTFSSGGPMMENRLTIISTRLFALF